MIRPVRVTQRQFGKVIEVPEGDEVISIAVGAMGGWNPRSLGLSNLYDATKITGFADGASMPSWLDVSGSGINATQVTPAAQPIYKVNQQNGLPAVSFPVNQFFTVAQALPQPFTAIAVLSLHVDNSANKATWFNFITGGQSVVQSGNGVSPVPWTAFAGAFLVSTKTYAQDTFHVVSVVFNGANGILSVDGSADVVTGNVGTNGPATWALGPNAAGFNSVRLGEVHVAPRALSLSEVLHDAAYLKGKWATP